MACVHVEPVQGIKLLGSDMFMLTVRSSHVAKNAKPGQFVNIKCGEGLDAYLRRPISICNIDRDKETFDLGIQIKGKGTSLLCGLPEGRTIDFLGPLGNGFKLDSQNKRIAVVGGGIGIFPLMYLLKSKGNCQATSYLGFRNSSQVVLLEEFEKASDKLVITTEDGSMGSKGRVTESLELDLKNNEYDMVYTCGPIPMMRAVADICSSHGIPCQVSLEQRMGCGIGACLVCACKVKKSDEWGYAHVCKDGPVFDSREVIWD